MLGRGKGEEVVWVVSQGEAREWCSRDKVSADWKLGQRCRSKGKGETLRA